MNTIKKIPRELLNTRISAQNNIKSEHPELKFTGDWGGIRILKNVTAFFICSSSLGIW